MPDITFLSDGVEIGPRYAVECLMTFSVIATLAGAVALLIHFN